MQRNQTTTANQLKQGDRFYKTTDRTKTAFELTRIESRFLNSKYWCIEAEILDRPNPPTGDRGTKQISGNTAVIFLRSKLAKGNGLIATGNGLSGNQPKANSQMPNNVESKPEAHSPKTVNKYEKLRTTICHLQSPGL